MEATLPGVLTDVIIIHHTGALPASRTRLIFEKLTGADCGCTYQSDDRLKAKLKDRHPNHLHKHIDEVEWNTFGSKERSVTELTPLAANGVLMLYGIGFAKACWRISRL